MKKKTLSANRNASDDQQRAAAAAGMSNPEPDRLGAALAGLHPSTPLPLRSSSRRSSICHRLTP